MFRENWGGPPCQGVLLIMGTQRLRVSVGGSPLAKIRGAGRRLEAWASGCEQPRPPGGSKK